MKHSSLCIATACVLAGQPRYRATSSSSQYPLLSGALLAGTPRAGTGLPTAWLGLLCDQSGWFFPSLSFFGGSFTMNTTLKAAGKLAKQQADNKHCLKRKQRKTVPLFGSDFAAEGGKRQPRGCRPAWALPCFWHTAVQCHIQKTQMELAWHRAGSRWWCHWYCSVWQLLPYSSRWGGME